MDTVECTECGWIGFPEELWCSKEDEDKPVSESVFDTCPGCEAEGRCEDVEDEEY